MVSRPPVGTAMNPFSMHLKIPRNVLESGPVLSRSPPWTGAAEVGSQVYFHRGRLPNLAG